MTKSKQPRQYNHGDAESRLRKAYERLGTDSPKCFFGNETNPLCLELHHVPKRAFGSETVIVCLNHHARLSDAQKDHPAKINGCTDQLEAFGHFLLDLVAFLKLALDRLEQIAKALIERARTDMAEV